MVAQVTCRSHPQVMSQVRCHRSRVTIISDPGRYGQELRILCLPAGTHGSTVRVSYQFFFTMQIRLSEGIINTNFNSNRLRASKVTSIQNQPPHWQASTLMTRFGLPKLFRDSHQGNDLIAPHSHDHSQLIVVEILRKSTNPETYLLTNLMDTFKSWSARGVISVDCSVGKSEI